MAKTKEEREAEKAAKAEAKLKVKAEKDAAKAAAKQDKEKDKEEADKKAAEEKSLADIKLEDARIELKEAEDLKLEEDKKDKVDIVGIRDRDGKFGYIRTYSLKDNGPAYLKLAENYIAANPDKKPQIVEHNPGIAGSVQGS